MQARGNGCMLQRSMNAPAVTHRLQADLEDMLGSLHHARRTQDLGRLALLTYCEVRRWARVTRRELLAERAEKVVTERPHPSREAFLLAVDGVIEELERLHAQRG